MRPGAAGRRRVGVVVAVLAAAGVLLGWAGLAAAAPGVETGPVVEASVDGGAWGPGPVALIPSEHRFVPGDALEVQVRVRLRNSSGEGIRLAVGLSGRAADPLWTALVVRLSTAGERAVDVKESGAAADSLQVEGEVRAGNALAVNVGVALPASAGPELQRLETPVSLVLHAAVVPTDAAGAEAGGALAATGMTVPAGAWFVGGLATVMGGVLTLLQVICGWRHRDSLSWRRRAAPRTRAAH
ncbi:hypothetical protein ACEXQB_007850 [Herbiconiux sp. P18]|uniref:hypothetical protein n=1 Tax=Herbiconiux liangxiaofengii TaxID=3342795 RepID=UPI0035B9E212